MLFYCPECGAAYGRSEKSPYALQKDSQVLCNCGTIYLISPPDPPKEPESPEDDLGWTSIGGRYWHLG